MKNEILNNWQTYPLSEYKIETLKIHSHSLKNNPLGDSQIRYNPLLVPTSNGGPWPVIFVLAGFSGNAPFYFHGKFNDKNAIQIIDQATKEAKAPLALYVFVDAITSWGGSQFINSSAVGQYEDYIVNDLVEALKMNYEVSNQSQDWAIVGGSSGGFGALHLSSKFPEFFGHCAAIAPDSFFEASLLPELYTALPYLEKFSTAKRILDEVRSGKIQKQKNYHSLLNAFAMAACYSPVGSEASASVEFDYPLDLKTGKLKLESWKRWQEKDPINFLPERKENLAKLHSIYLDVGNRDNFHLQYGVRQISALLKSMNIDHDYTEFDGNHFDIGDRRIDAWNYLAMKMRA